MKKAERLERLGTETAFLVSAEAAVIAATGKKVYPFHLGDINLPTPTNVREAGIAALNSGKTGYCAAAGILALREAIAENVGTDRDLRLQPNQVSVQPGGKPVIGKFIQVAMEKGDEVLYPNPGYPIYESQIAYYGGIAKSYRYIEAKAGFQLDLDYLKSQISQRTTCLIYNNYQNPLGAQSSIEEMEAVAELALRNDLWVLSDEAYFEVLYRGKGRSIASLAGMAERSAILYTFSKKFAMTGWRLGACIAPPEFTAIINKLNTNAESCTNHFIQYAGLEGLRGPQHETKQILAILQQRRDACVALINAMPGVHCSCPDSTFYLFANVTEAMHNLQLDDVEIFRKGILQETGVSFCTRRHFGTPQSNEKQHYIRFAYSGIDETDINEGLLLMKEYLISNTVATAS